MVDSIDFKELFSKWSYTKEEDKTRFINELNKIMYSNGKLYYQEE